MSALGHITLVCVEEFEEWRKCLLFLKMTESREGSPVTKGTKSSCKSNIATKNKTICYKLRKHTGCFSPAEFKDHEVEVKSNCLINHVYMCTYVYIYGWGF